MECYKCKGSGHFVVVCPTRDKDLAFICEKELIGMETMDKTKEEEVDGSISDEEEHVGATNLPSCVIQRVLSGTKKDLKANLEWLCTNIFHTHMEHGDRALNIIIDDGSRMNVIFETAVERLVLKIEKHPTPCQISWVNEDNSVLVKDRCLVRFLSGKTYMDEA